MTEKKSFWSSIPGIITGTATVITACLGLITAFNSSSKDSPPAAASPSPEVSSTAAATPSSSVSPEVLTTELPEAVVLPQSVEFGEQGIGRPASRSVTVSNPGDAPLEIGDVRIEGTGAASFSVSQNGCTAALEPGGRCTINLEFRPSSTGDQSATLTLDHNAQDSPTEVPVAGRGVLLQL